MAALSNLKNTLKKPAVYGFFGGLVIGIIICGFYFTLKTSNPVSFQPILAGQQGLINPLLAIKTLGQNDSGEFNSIKKSVNKVIDDAKVFGNANQVSVYFRDLNSSQWVGINQDLTYFPASLFKVPIMISYLQQAESDPQILQRQLYYGMPTDTADEEKYSPTTQLLHTNQVYTVNQLIRSMIVNSDNGAMDLLLDNSDKDFLSDLFSELGITLPDNTINSAADYGISARTYSLFFRTLYNATILNRNDSQKALKLLTQTAFKDGLNAGVPNKLVVAHKFGEHLSPPIGDEFHDCGIIYYPNKPYLLCVMTKGKDINKLISTIAQISKAVYEDVKK